MSIVEVKLSVSVMIGFGLLVLGNLSDILSLPEFEECHEKFDGAGVISFES